LDSYLDIAAIVLRSERRPLRPPAILAAAYRAGLVPPHLYGKTQHKTLQARLSEDIVERKERSSFFRTSPGRFFLREFLADTSLPEEFRTPVPTRRRLRELVKGPALAIHRRKLEQVMEHNTAVKPEVVLKLLRGEESLYGEPRKRRNDIVFLRSFVCVSRQTSILSYRLGRYRDDRDEFLSKRSLGFSTLVQAKEHTLFTNDFGIIDAGVHATKLDLDFPEVPHEEELSSTLSCFIWVNNGSDLSDLLAIIWLYCPNWFEPLKRRLALNDLRWCDASVPINNIDDFDPWSRSILSAKLLPTVGCYVNTIQESAISR
jgi:hypothetical protein